MIAEASQTPKEPSKEDAALHRIRYQKVPPGSSQLSRGTGVGVAAQSRQEAGGVHDFPAEGGEALGVREAPDPSGAPRC